MADRTARIGESPPDATAELENAKGAGGGQNNKIMAGDTRTFVLPTKKKGAPRGEKREQESFGGKRGKERGGGGTGMWAR